MKHRPITPAPSSTARLETPAPLLLLPPRLLLPAAARRRPPLPPLPPLGRALPPRPLRRRCPLPPATPRLLLRAPLRPLLLGGHLLLPPLLLPPAATTAHPAHRHAKAPLLAPLLLPLAPPACRLPRVGRPDLHLAAVELEALHRLERRLRRPLRLELDEAVPAVQLFFFWGGGRMVSA